MKNSQFHPLLLISPVVLFLASSILKGAHGPYYIFLFDHSYAYLAYSLNLSQFSNIGISPHPGTPIQIIGAIVLKLSYIFSHTRLDMIQDVLIHSEKYLSLLHITFISLNSIAVLILGIYSYKVTNNLILSLFIQLSAFGSVVLFLGLVIVGPEQFLIFSTFCLIGIAIFYLYKFDSDHDPSLKLILITAFICGMGLAAKLNFFPLLVIPIIIIPRLKYKLIFCLLTIFFFCILIIPVITSQFSYFVEWMKNLVIYDAKFRQGNQTVLDTTSFFNNVYFIFDQNLYFSLSYLAALITLLIIIFKRSKLLNPTILKAKKLLIGIFITFNMQIFLVARHNNTSYMIPSLMISNLCLIVCILILTFIFQKKHLKFRNLIYAFLIINTGYSFYIFSGVYEILFWNKMEGIRTENYILTAHKNDIVVSAFNSSSLNAVVTYSTTYAANKKEIYKSILNEIFTNKIYYVPWGNELYFLCSKKEIDEILSKNNKLIFQFKGEESLNDFVEKLEKIGNLEITGKKELFRNEITEFVYEINYEYNKPF